MSPSTRSTEVPARFAPDHWLLCGMDLDDLPSSVRDSGLFQWREQCGLVQPVSFEDLHRTVAHWLRAQPVGRVCVMLCSGDPAQRLAALRCVPDAESPARVGVLWMNGDPSDEARLRGLLARPDASVVGEWLNADAQVLVPEPYGDWPSDAMSLWRDSFQTWAEATLEFEALAFDNEQDAREHVLALYGCSPESGAPVANQSSTPGFQSARWDAAGVDVMSADDRRDGEKTSREPVLSIEGTGAHVQVLPQRARSADSGWQTVALQFVVKNWAPRYGRLRQLELYVDLQLPILLRWNSGEFSAESLEKTLYVEDVADLRSLFEACRMEGRVQVLARTAPEE